MDRRQKIVAVASSHTCCSPVLDVGLYVEAVIRPVDRTERLRGFYFNNKDLSTCAIFAVRCIGAAGCDEPECVASYLPEGGVERDAMVDISVLAHRFGAWVEASPNVRPPQLGDIWIVTGVSGDAHTGVCTSDAIVNPDGSWLVPTAEGGQVPVDAKGRIVGGCGSSAQEAFVRRFVQADGLWHLGGRTLLGYVSAELLPIPDDVAVDAGDGAI
jgi:hypothetical protein